MAVEIFLHVDGLKGGSRNYYHKGWSDVVSWRWALGIDGTGRTMDRIEVVKRIGMDSAGLLALFAEGGTAPSARLTMVPVVGKREAQQKFLTLSLEDVNVVAFCTGATTEDTVFTEELTLRFQRVTFEFNQYTESASGGAASGGAAPEVESYAFAWDMARNTGG